MVHFPVDGIRKGLPTSAGYSGVSPLQREKAVITPIRSLPVSFHHRWGIKLTALPTIESHESPNAARAGYGETSMLTNREVLYEERPPTVCANIARSPNIHPDLPRDPIRTVNKRKYITYRLHVGSGRRKIKGMILVQHIGC